MEGRADSVIYWSRLEWGEWVLAAAVTSRGLCYAGKEEHLDPWIRKHWPQSRLVLDEERLEPYLDQYREYFDGHRTDFTFPLDLRGTDFQRAVWAELRRIPYGETRAYSQVAARVGKPRGARAAGAAIGANPVLIAVPCHRVIGKDGSLTGFGSGLDMKRRLLELERRGPLS